MPTERSELPRKLPVAQAVQQLFARIAVGGSPYLTCMAGIAWRVLAPITPSILPK